MSDLEWRPLRNGEYPPPGPTKLADPVERNGQMVRPILVLTPHRYCACGRDLHGYRGPRCRYCDGTAE
jgi:hypothetical protein